MRKTKVTLIILLVIVTGLTAALELYYKPKLDSTAPTVTCDKDVLEVSVKAEERELLQGVTARDDQDGDLTDQIMIDHVSALIGVDTAKITYVVFDSSSNVGKLTRTIHYTDYEAPKFQLSAPLRYQVGNTVTILDRMKVQDVIDGDITNNIRMTTQNLNIATEGIYSITLQVTNSLGDTSVLPLSVIIQSGTRLPEIQLTDYLIYLKTGDSFTPESYLKRVIESGKVMDLEDVTIDSNVNVDKVGVYEVFYQYTGERGTGRAILTVVVE